MTGGVSVTLHHRQLQDPPGCRASRDLLMATNYRQPTRVKAKGRPREGQTRPKAAEGEYPLQKGLVNPPKRSPLLASQWLHRLQGLFRITLSLF